MINKRWQAMAWFLAAMACAGCEERPHIQAHRIEEEIRLREAQMKLASLMRVGEGEGEQINITIQPEDKTLRTEYWGGGSVLMSYDLGGDPNQWLFSAKMLADLADALVPVLEERGLLDGQPCGADRCTCRHDFVINGGDLEFTCDDDTER